jgi:hypothetical protein
MCAHGDRVAAVFLRRAHDLRTGHASLLDEHESRLYVWLMMPAARPGRIRLPDILARIDLSIPIGPRASP